MKKLVYFILGAALLCPQLVFAQEANYNIYPVNAVFLSNNLQSEEFKALYKNPLVKKVFAENFVKNLKNKYPNSVNEITNKNKYKTVVSYISIPRASKYIEKRPNGNIIYLPLTATLNFANILTGETLYTTSFTPWSITQDSSIENINNCYKAKYNEALAGALAKADFTIEDIKTKVIDKYKDVYILDKGNESGLAKSDLLFDENANQLSIIYSTQNYSVAKVVLGDKIRMHTEFVKQIVGGIGNHTKKIKVLFINDLLNDSLYDSLVTNLGKDSKINLLTYNQTFNNMRSAVVGLNSNFYASNIYQRDLPDYYIMFNFTPPVKTTNLQNQSGLSNTYYQMMGCGTIFDKAGKIVFAECANDQSLNRFENDKYGAQQEDILDILLNKLVKICLNKSMQK